MPRIEIIPTGWDQSPEKAAGDGTPTEDVCSDCAKAIEEGMNVLDYFPAAVCQSGVIGSIEIVHPSYDDDDYVCACCGEKLFGEED